MWLSFDGLHHWHEIRFTYAANFFLIEDILGGKFSPEQIGGEFDEASSGGFYIAKILHVALLKFMFSILPPHQGGFTMAVWASMLLMGMTTLLGYVAFKGVFRDKWLAWLAWVCMVIMPITPYLGGKLLSEVLALVFVAVSLCFFIQAVNRPGPGWKLFAAFSGGTLLLAGLTRLDSILCVIGFAIAFALTALESKQTQHIWKVLGVTFSVFLLGYIAVLFLMQIDPRSLIEYFEHYSQIGMKSYGMSILGILTFAGMAYLFVGSSLFSKNPQARKNIIFFFVWLTLACGPNLFITWNYMVEPRYLLNGLLPLAGLGAIGLDAGLKRLKSSSAKMLVWGLGISIITFVNYGLLNIMPYELDQKSLTRMVDQVMEDNPSSILLVPWTYTDFHFLRVMYPAKAIKNINQVVFEEGKEKLVKETRNKIKLWYGNAYVDSASQVAQMLEKFPVFYLGWKYYPPATFVKQLGDLSGIQPISSLIERLQLKNHLKESWLWNHPSFEVEFNRQVGQYELYMVRKS